MSERKKFFIIAGVTAAVYLMIRYLLPYVLPFFIALILVRMLNPVLKRIRRRLPWKKEILTGILISLFFALAGALLYFLCEAVTHQVCRIAADFDHYYNGVNGFLDDCCNSMERKIGLKTGRIRSVVDREFRTAVVLVEGKMIPEFLNHSFQYLMKMMKAAGFFFLIFIAVILLMRDYERITEQLKQYEFFRRGAKVLRRICHTGGAYLRAQLLLIGIITVMCVAGLYLLGNGFALVLGIIIGLLDALPFLGTGTVLLPWAVVLLFRKQYALALGYAGLFFITNTTRELLEPRLVGKHIGVYPIAIALAVYMGACLFGPTGVFTGPAGLILIMEICREIFSGGIADAAKKGSQTSAGREL